jgi:hypothetical protein
MQKISKGIGILFKLRDFVLIDILIQVYHSVIYLFLIYAALPGIGTVLSKNNLTKTAVNLCQI